ncbi:MAG: hypothetical protein LBV44_02905 [Methylobacillus sp.]|jgi:hypothetical protein|nr:hypothetical protein [Methylobacillus sp.]
MNAKENNVFKQGQAWSYETRPGEKNSTVLINLVESHPELGEIFHISMRDVRVKNPQAPSGMTTDLSHFPVSLQTLQESCTALRGEEAPNPGFREGYAIWKAEFDEDRAGIFTISIAEIVGFIEKAINGEG